VYSVQDVVLVVTIVRVGHRSDVYRWAMRSDNRSEGGY
jgi:mRNA-degrading endonuclease RelE of RelBE toxin-antitoxin system